MVADGTGPPMVKVRSWDGMSREEQVWSHAVATSMW